MTTSYITRQKVLSSYNITKITLYLQIKMTRVYNVKAKKNKKQRHVSNLSVQQFCKQCLSTTKALQFSCI